MKTLSALVICTLFTAQVIAQQKGTTKTHQVKSPLSPEKTKMLCKPWKLDTVENFGVAAGATAKEQNDGMTFLADSTFFITEEGVPGSGKWKPLWGTTISATYGGTTTITKQFKIMSITDSKLVVSYQNPDLITTIYIYSAKPKKQD
jgi:hypothetical protein